jgi:phosphoglycolate phosphatase
LTNRSIRAVLFDLDGTLLDTAPDLIRVLNQVRREQGRDALPYAQARTQVSHGSAGLIRLGFPDLSGQALETLRLRLL